MHARSYSRGTRRYPRTVHIQHRTRYARHAWRAYTHVNRRSPRQSIHFRANRLSFLPCPPLFTSPMHTFAARVDHVFIFIYIIYIPGVSPLLARLASRAEGISSGRVYNRNKHQVISARGSRLRRRKTPVVVARTYTRACARRCRDVVRPDTSKTKIHTRQFYTSANTFLSCKGLRAS